MRFHPLGFHPTQWFLVYFHPSDGREDSPNMNTMVLMRGMRPAAVWGPASKGFPKALWGLRSELMVRLGGPGPGGRAAVWEFMVRVRADRNISRLDVYSRALRPALSIKLAATTTERRRTAPTMMASYLREKTAGRGTSGASWD